MSSYDPIAIGSCCCNMIIACERARDFDRAGQWCEQLAAFCERTGQRPLLALCRAHHGTVLTMRGEWSQAEEELDWAAGELIDPAPAAGRLRARPFRRAAPAPGQKPRSHRAVDAGRRHTCSSPLIRAALALDDDDPSAALGHAEKYLRSHGEKQPIERAMALELLVAARVRLGELDPAREAHAQLAAIAAAVATDSLRAAERSAAGRIALADRDHDEARSALEDAIDLYERSVAPFEAAQARVRARTRAGGWGAPQLGARSRRMAARAVFEELGAKRALREADKLVGRLGGPDCRGQARRPDAP